LTDKELLEALDTAESGEVDFSSDLPTVEKFLVEMNIKPGPNRVLKSTLTNLYLTFYKTRKSSTSKKYISAGLSEHLPTHQVGPRVYFLIDKSSIEIAQTTIDIHETRRHRHNLRFKMLALENFIERHSITDGPHLVKMYYLYDLFCSHYAISGKRPPILELMFNSLLKTMFEHKRVDSSRGIGYYINKKPSEILSIERRRYLSEQKKKTKSLIKPKS
jgi:hypothetical protein